MLPICSRHLECSIVGAHCCLMVRRWMKERSTVVHVGGIATMHGVKYQHLKKKFSSTRRSNSPTNFDPAPATFTPKRHCSTLLKASHASTASTAKLAGVSVSHAAAASSSRPSSLQHPQFPALPSNRRPPLATLPDPKPKQTHSVVPCAGIPHGVVGSALSAQLCGEKDAVHRASAHGVVRRTQCWHSNLCIVCIGNILRDASPFYDILVRRSRVGFAFIAQRCALHTSPKPNKQFQHCTACKEHFKYG